MNSVCQVADGLVTVHGAAPVTERQRARSGFLKDLGELCDGASSLPLTVDAFVHWQQYVERAAVPCSHSKAASLFQVRTPREYRCGEPWR
jgi:hypothetical protein